MPYGTGKHTYEIDDGWAKLPKGEKFLDIIKISIDSNDNVYMATRGTEHPIMMFDRQGNLLKTWGEEFFGRPHGFLVGPDGSFWVTDNDHHVVSKYTQEGKLLLELGNRDKPSDTGFIWGRGRGPDNVLRRGAPPFNAPANICIAPSGEIYVADGYGNARVHKFSPDGKLLASWGEPGDKPGEFKTPHAVWADKQNRVWVCDRENNRIQIFDTQGKFLEMWNMDRPADMFIDDKEETVYVAGLNRLVSIYDIKGKLLAQWGDTEEDKEKALILAPHDIAVDSRGDMYIGEVAMTIAKVDRGNRVVRKFVLQT